MRAVDSDWIDPCSVSFRRRDDITGTHSGDVSHATEAIDAASLPTENGRRRCFLRQIPVTLDSGNEQLMDSGDNALQVNGPFRFPQPRQ
jgi:hypothetical protein